MEFQIKLDFSTKKAHNRFIKSSMFLSIFLSIKEVFKWNDVYLDRNDFEIFIRTIRKV